MENYYQTIETTSIAEFKDRGSKFMAYAFPINTVADFKFNMQQVKAAHPKADHFCFGYRLGIDGNAFRSSDDGEPSGSAGKPILGQIDSKNITNVFIVVVRYFGGTLLGVPGLINAYKTTAAFALQTVPIIQKEIVAIFHLQFDYTQMNEIMKSIKQFRGTIIKNESSLFSIVDVEIPKTEVSAFQHNISRLDGVVFKILE
jgi:uncharacterized YigZ family protein